MPSKKNGVGPFAPMFASCSPGETGPRRTARSLSFHSAPGCGPGLRVSCLARVQRRRSGIDAGHRENDIPTEMMAFGRGPGAPS